MNAILATAGLNDLAIEFVEATEVCFFLVISVLLAVSWCKRSQVAAVIASFLLLLEGAMLEPWTAITPAADPYDVYWVFRLRVICAIWALLLIAAIACWVRAFRRKKQKKRTV